MVCLVGVLAYVVVVEKFGADNLVLCDVAVDEVVLVEMGECFEEHVCDAVDVLPGEAVALVVGEGVEWLAGCPVHDNVRNAVNGAAAAWFDESGMRVEVRGDAGPRC